VDEGVSLPEMHQNNEKLDLVPFHCVVDDRMSHKMCPTTISHRNVPSIVIPPPPSAGENGCMSSNFESPVANRPNTIRIGRFRNSPPTEYVCGFDSPGNLFANASELGDSQSNETLIYNTGLGIGTTNDSSGTNDLLPLRCFGQELTIPEFVYENHLPLSHLGNGHDGLSQSDTDYRQHEYRGHVAGEVFSLTGSQSPHSQSSIDFSLHNQPNDLVDTTFSEGHIPRGAESIGAFPLTSFRNRTTPYHDDAFSISPSSNTAAEFVNLAYGDSNDFGNWDMMDDGGQAVSSYAASDAGSTRTRGTSITMIQDPTFLPVPGHPCRRSSDPNPAAPNGLSQSSIRRTSSTKSRGRDKNTKNYPEAPSQPRSIVRKGADPLRVGPRIPHVQMPPRTRGKRIRTMSETEKASMNLAKLKKHTCVRCKWGKVIVSDHS
jgi:hypothetical protein